MNRLKQLVSKRLQMQGPGPHPDADTLSAFAENTLSRAEQKKVLGHVADCRDCRDVLYLAQPDLMETQPGAAYRPGRTMHFAFRWGAVAASLVIVAGGVFLTRQEFFRAEHKSTQAPAIQNYDKVAAEKTPAEPGSTRIAETAAPTSPTKEKRRTDLSAGVPSKPRPEEKHMTAKLQSPLKFDSSDQVQMAPAANARAADGHDKALEQRQNSVASYGMLDQSGTQQAAAKAKDAEALSYAAGGRPAPPSMTPKNFGGTVFDPTGGTVPNAQITMVGPAGAKTVTSDQEGKFNFDQLTPGPYSLKVQAPGFKTTEITEVVVLDRKTQDLPVKLEVGGTAETVSVIAATPVKEPEEAKIAGALLSASAFPSAQTTAEIVVRDDNQAAKLSRKKAAPEIGTGSAGKVIPQAQWTISAEGALQRSLDSGKSWEIIPVGNASGFRAIFSADSEVWVGGKAGALYHSSDSGQTWKQLTPSSGGERLAGDISHIEFSDSANGWISTVNGETWLTSDGGQTWRKK